MINKDILIALLESSSKWEFLDVIMSINPETYQKINNIYTETLSESSLNYNKIAKICGITINGFILIFLTYTRYNMYLSKADPLTFHATYLRYLETHPMTSFKEFQQMTTLGDKAIDFMIEYGSIPMYLQTFFKHLFKTSEFHHQFNEAVSNYILELLNDDSLKEQIIEIIIKLINN